MPVQVYRPERDMPLGMLGAIVASALLYVLMCLCICLMQPSNLIDLEAPFAAAFASLIRPDSGRLQTAFLTTSARFVSFGALTGRKGFGQITSFCESILARVVAVCLATVIAAWILSVPGQCVTDTLAQLSVQW